jgi:hypothetical protein
MVIAANRDTLGLCGLTFELTPTAEAGGVSPVTDDATNGGRRAYDACRSGSGAERGVRPHLRCGDWVFGYERQAHWARRRL